MKKTFVEVMMCIKEGETWENEFKTITRGEGGFIITLKRDTPVKTMCFDNDKSYSLVIKSVSFTEAFEAYEEGKRIKSLVGEKTEYIKIEEDDLWFDDIDNTWNNNYDLDIEEIRGQWQILD